MSDFVTPLSITTPSTPLGVLMIGIFSWFRGGDLDRDKDFQKQFDRSGTTRIGKYVSSHSFILPGLIGVTTSCIFGYLLAGMRGLV